MKTITITITATIGNDIIDEQIDALALAAAVQVSEPENMPAPTNVATTVVVTPDDDSLISELAGVLIDGFYDSAIFEDIETAEDFIVELRRIAADETDTMWFTIAEVAGHASEGERSMALRHQIVAEIAMRVG